MRVFDRGDLKRNANALRANYWMTVVTGLLLKLALSGFGIKYVNNIMKRIGGPTYIITMFWILVLFVPVYIFLINPLIVGCQRYFIETKIYDFGDGRDIGHVFGKGYFKVVLAMLLKNLVTTSWYVAMIVLFAVSGIFKGGDYGFVGAIFMVLGFALVVPAVIFEYSFIMVPLLLAECPEKGVAALSASWEIMDGRKLEYFILNLSFLGWNLLGILTFGILSVFYVNPYFYSTVAVFFLAVCGNRRDYLESHGFGEIIEKINSEKSESGVSNPKWERPKWMSEEETKKPSETEGFSWPD